MDYEQLLKLRVTNILKTQTQPLSFYEIVSMAEGAFPTEVLRILNEFPDLKEKFYIDQTPAKQNIGTKSIVGGNNNTLSDPHPLDYDWRFSDNSIKKICDYLVDNFSADDTVALLGIKTLFKPLKSKFSKVTLFNKSKTLTDEITEVNYPHEIVIHDLSLPFGKERQAYSLVIADPPWYTEYYEAFISRSTALLKDGGFLYLVLLPRLTRPFAEKDRDKILKFCFSAGYDFVEKNMVELVYNTPTFETKSLSIAGLYSKDWRKGDLFKFQKMRSPQIQIDKEIDLFEEEWDELRLGSKKVKFLRKTDSGLLFGFNFADPKGPYLSQVSRRAEFREKVNFWTSDNLALNITRLSVLKEAIKVMSLGKSLTDTVLYCQNIFLLTTQEQKDLLIVLKMTINEK